MKTFLIISLYLIFGYSIGNAQPTPPSSDSILNAAKIRAAKENKNVFVIFRASWCSWCYKMDSSINDKRCKQMFDDNYIICHLVVWESKNKKNLENPGAMDLYAKYNGADQGLPFWLILDKNGDLIADSQIRKEGEGLDKKGQNTGCPTEPEEVNYFISVLKKTSRMTVQELATVEKRFLENGE